LRNAQKLYKSLQCLSKIINSIIYPIHIYIKFIRIDFKLTLIVFVTNTDIYTNIVSQLNKIQWSRGRKEGVPRVISIVLCECELSCRYFISRVAHGRAILLLYRRERTISCATQVVKQLLFQNITFNIVQEQPSDDIIVTSTTVIYIIYKYNIRLLKMFPVSK